MRFSAQCCALISHLLTNICAHLWLSCSTSSGSPHLLWASGLVPVLVPVLVLANSGSRSEHERTVSPRRRTLRQSGCTEGTKHVIVIDEYQSLTYLNKNLKYQIQLINKDCYLYHRVSDGEVEHRLCVFFQSFNKLKIFGILGLQIRQHFHTLTKSITS